MSSGNIEVKIKLEDQEKYQGPAYTIARKTSQNLLDCRAPPGRFGR